MLESSGASTLEQAFLVNHPTAELLDSCLGWVRV